MGKKENFEGSQYNINLIANDIQLGQYLISVEMVSNIHRLYPRIILKLLIPQHVYVDVVRFIDSQIKLTIEERLETKRIVKTFESELMIINHDFIYSNMSKKISETKKAAHASDLTTLTILAAPYMPYVFSNTLVKAKVYRNMKLKEILEEVAAGIKLEIKEEFVLDKADFKIKELFIPTMTVRDVIYFLNKWYGFYKSPFLAYITFDNEKKQKIDDQKIRLIIDVLNKKDKKDLEMLKLQYSNTKFYNATILKDVQRKSDDPDVTAYNPAPVIVQNYLQPLIEGYYQDFIFKPLDDLSFTIHNKLGQKEKEDGVNDIDKKDIYVLSRDKREAEVSAQWDLFNPTKVPRYKTQLTGYNTRDKKDFNEMLVCYNDASISNNNFSIYFEVLKGVNIEQFRIPGRLINVYSQLEDNPGINRMYFLSSSVIIFSKSHNGVNGYTYMASASIKASRANINDDKDCFNKTASSLIKGAKNYLDKFMG